MNALLELAKRCEQATGVEDADLAFLDRDIHRVVANDPVAELLDAPDFTISLDAAALLVPEDLDWAVGHGVDPQDRQLVDYAWCGKGQGEMIFAKSPALALCAAALKARAA